jgi:phospholipid transport system substrate-binding protein
MPANCLISTYHRRLFQSEFQEAKMLIKPCRTALIVAVQLLTKTVACHAPSLLGLLLAISLLAWPICAGAAPLDPSAVVGRFNDKLLAAMAQEGRPGYAVRYRLLEDVVDATFDVALMTRMAVGPSWAGVPENQQQRIIDAFRQFIVATFAERFDGYSGEKFEIRGDRSMGPGILVENALVPPNGEPVRINYLMHETAAGWRVVDVYLDGTISELAVRRSEFTAILKQSGAEGLITALERKTQTLAASG